MMLLTLHSDQAGHSLQLPLTCQLVSLNQSVITCNAIIRTAHNTQSICRNYQDAHKLIINTMH